MSIEEMKEIASVIKMVLSHTKAEISKTGENAGKPSKAKYIVDNTAKAETIARVKKLLDRFPVYPQLDLALLRNYFGK